MRSYDSIVCSVASELSLPKEYVHKVYQGYWKAVRQYVSSLPLKDSLTDEEFKELRPNVNIPSIGKLYITLDHYKRMKSCEKYIKEPRKRY